MSESQGDLDRNEPASEHKLEKAHARGSIVRSADVGFACLLVALVACIFGLGLQLANDLGSLVQHAFAFLSRPRITDSQALALALRLAARAAFVAAPLVLILWASVALAGALQARGVFTAEPLKPDFSRLNPAKGIQRVFSMKSLHELWRSTAKLALIGTAMTLWGHSRLVDLVGLERDGPRKMTHDAIAMTASAVTLLAAIIVAFALVDWTFNRWDFMRQMRMSKRDVQDEHKERDGNPRIKARLRELRQEWLKRMRQLAQVRKSDVLITNPTHYAVALAYRHGQMPAPMISARGAGELAANMRKEARRWRVPIVENAPLARALFALSQEQVFVPEQHFEQVARIIKWVQATSATASQAKGTK